MNDTILQSVFLVNKYFLFTCVTYSEIVTFLYKTLTTFLHKSWADTKKWANNCNKLTEWNCECCGVFQNGKKEQNNFDFFGEIKKCISVESVFVIKHFWGIWGRLHLELFCSGKFFDSHFFHFCWKFFHLPFTNNYRSDSNAPQLND